MKIVTVGPWRNTNLKYLERWFSLANQTLGLRRQAYLMHVWWNNWDLNPLFYVSVLNQVNWFVHSRKQISAWIIKLASVKQYSIVSCAIEHKTYLKLLKRTGKQNKKTQIFFLKEMKLLKENGKPFSGHCQHLQRSSSSRAAVGQGISRRDRGIHWQVGPTAQHGASPLRPTRGRTRRPVHPSQQGRTSWGATWPSRRWFPFLPSDLLRLALPLRNCGALPWQRKKEGERERGGGVD